MNSSIIHPYLYTAYEEYIKFKNLLFEIFFFSYYLFTYIIIIFNNNKKL